MAKIKNNFNDLGPKEWLPFQKSFTQFQDMESLIESNLRFFTKPSLEPRQNVLGYGSNEFGSLIKTKSLSLKLENDSTFETVDFLAADLTDSEISISAAIEWILKNRKNLNYRKFLWVLIPNDLMDEKGVPFAWSLSNQLAGCLTRKDEKIICHPDGTTWTSLYFRKDEHSSLQKHSINQSIHQPNKQSTNQLKNWFILKPKPRSKDEILHPAKYPEDLVEMYLNKFTQKGDTVFDPMSGTGTTQVTSLQLGRNAYGVELSDLFHEIATNRCSDLDSNNQWKIFQGDARDIQHFEIPELDYIITSPPYWDMLNMKGAEVQASRKAKGLQTNYSENENDLGNLDDYSNFLEVLIDIYKKTAEKLKTNGHLTIVVKNVKKKGKHYPLAFDLTKNLTEFLKFNHVGFWCQDDLQIAPYGYKHTWVSNTFHHYCLTFQKA
jgi:DNA modification methylase